MANDLAYYLDTYDGVGAAYGAMAKVFPSESLWTPSTPVCRS